MGYFRSDGKYIYLDCEYAEFYIPLSYFDATTNLAINNGKIISVIGIFNVGIFEGGKLKEYKVFNVPTWVQIENTDSEIRQIDLPNEKDIPCRIMKFHKGNKIMASTVIKDSSNAQLFLKMITSGKVPPSIPYSKVLSIWRENQKLSGVNLGVESIIQEVILATAYRDPNNLEKPFATLIGQDKPVSEYAYKMLSIRQICQYSATFTAMTFEDFDSMVTTSLNRTRSGKEEIYTPVEQIIHM